MLSWLPPHLYDNFHHYHASAPTTATMQSASDVVYVYLARQACRGADPREPDMEINDVIHVSADFLHQQKMAPDSPNGWLLGTNMRTRQEGYFPGEAGP